MTGCSNSLADANPGRPPGANDARYPQVNRYVGDFRPGAASRPALPGRRGTDKADHSELFSVPIDNTFRTEVEQHSCRTTAYRADRSRNPPTDLARTCGRCRDVRSSSGLPTSVPRLGVRLRRHFGLLGTVPSSDNRDRLGQMGCARQMDGLS